MVGAYSVGYFRLARTLNPAVTLGLWINGNIDGIYGVAPTGSAS